MERSLEIVVDTPFDDDGDVSWLEQTPAELGATAGVLCFFLGLWASAIALVLVAWLLALWGERK